VHPVGFTCKSDRTVNMCIRFPTDGKILSPLYTKKVYRGDEIQPNSFLTSALYCVEWSAAGFGRFKSGTHLTGGFVGPTAGLNGFHGEQYLVLLLETESFLGRSGRSLDPIATELSKSSGNKLPTSVSVPKHIHQLIC
jgi:hypothetical protein